MWGHFRILQTLYCSTSRASFGFVAEAIDAGLVGRRILSVPLLVLTKQMLDIGMRAPWEQAAASVGDALHVINRRG
jgi:hypothetical protein